MNSAIITKRYPENIRTDVLRTLMEHPIEGVPRIRSIRLSGSEWIVEEDRVQGETLAEYIRGRAISEKEAASICRELCAILERVHALGIVHGDIKPENIMRDLGGRLWLIDFDASHFVKPENGRDTVMMGTPGYASPEQFGFGRSDPRSDIYAMGILLNVMITGRHPLYEKASGRLAPVIERCTHVDPERRYQSVTDLDKALKRPVREDPKRPPGFRTLHPLKMLTASAGYAFIVYFSFFLREFSVELLFVEIWVFLTLLAIVFIAFDYMNVISLVTDKKGWPRFFAALLEVFIFSSIALVILYTLQNLIT